MRSFVAQNKKVKVATFIKALYRAIVSGAEYINLINYTYFEGNEVYSSL